MLFLKPRSCLVWTMVAWAFSLSTFASAATSIRGRDYIVAVVDAAPAPAIRLDSTTDDEGTGYAALVKDPAAEWNNCLYALPAMLIGAWACQHWNIFDGLQRITFGVRPQNNAGARAVLDQLKRPDVDFIHGLSPVLAIEQRTGGGSHRSTVATVTEVADYARLLWALCGEQRCPKDGGRVEKRSLDDCLAQLFRDAPGERAIILAPVGRDSSLALMMLNEAGYSGIVATHLPMLCDAMEEGAACARCAAPGDCSRYTGLFRGGSG